MRRFSGILLFCGSGLTLYFAEPDGSLQAINRSSRGGLDQ